MDTDLRFYDVGICFVPTDGKEWALFLQKKLKEVDIVSEIEDLSGDCRKHCSVIVVLATPDILDLQCVDHIQTMDIEQSIMVLLGTDESELKWSFVKQKYKDICNWMFFRAQETDHSVNDLIDQIQTILDKVRRTMALSDYDFPPLPRPSQAELRQKVQDRSTGQCLKVATSDAVKTIEVFILSERKGSDEIDICFDKCPEIENKKAVYEEAAAYRLQIPETINTDEEKSFAIKDDMVSYGMGILPKIDKPRKQIILNSRETIAQETITNLFGNQQDPVSLMCHILGLNIDDGPDVSLLDKDLACKCQRMRNRRCDVQKILLDEGCKSTKWPSLLHFAAEYNLKLFGEELLKLPFSTDVCFSMNNEKETPQKIANRNGYADFSQMISNFLKEQIIKGNTPGNKDSGIPDDKRLPTISEQGISIESPNSITLKNDGVYEDHGKISSNDAKSLWNKLKKKKSKKRATASDYFTEDNKESYMDTKNYGNPRHLTHSKSATFPSHHSTKI